MTKSVFAEENLQFFRQFLVSQERRYSKVSKVPQSGIDDAFEVFDNSGSSFVIDGVQSDKQMHDKVSKALTLCSSSTVILPSL